jgi:beta-lactamase regulating signal transducer with metallopeptidase domain
MTGNEILTFVVTAAIKGAVILAAAGLVTVSWRSASAAAKHLVWTIAVVLTLIVPLLSVALKKMKAPGIPVGTWVAAEPVAMKMERPATRTLSTDAGDPALPSQTSAVNDAPVISTDVDASSRTVDNAASETAANAVAAAPATDRAPFRMPSLAVIWAIGAIASLLPFFAALIRVRAVERRARKVRDLSWLRMIESTRTISHLAGRVEILESDTTAMPMTWGFIKPRLLVPSRSERWPEWQRRDVLLHELAHVERRDCLTQLLAQVACAVYWFNPLAWVAAHRMRIERELACDDRVIAAGAKASDYAANLLNVAKSLRAPSFTTSTAIAMARPSQLSGRLLAVLDSGRNRRSVSRNIALASTAAALALSIPLAALTPRAAAATITSGPAAIVKAVQIPAIASLAGSGLSVSVGKGDETTPEPPGSVAAPALQSAECWANDNGHNSVSINSNDEEGSDASYTVKYSSGNCSLEFRAEGKFTLRPDLSDVEIISNDGWIRLEERLGRDTRRMEIKRASNGSIDHQYWVNGDRAPYDANARAWLGRTLLSVERRTAFAAGTRVPQLYRAGGVNGVLSEISQMGSDYAKSRYYATMLDMGIKLDANTLNTVVRHASSDLAKSDYYMSEVLGKFEAQGAANEATWQIFAEAAGKMKSDYYKSSLLKRVLTKQRLSDQTVETLLRSASDMKSDYYLSDLLKSTARLYALNAGTRQYYADALRHIESDYYRADLINSLGAGDWDARTSNYVLTSVAEIKSDYYRSEALTKLVKDRHVNDWNAFFNAVSGIDSDYYKKSALVAAMKSTPGSRDVVAGVLAVVPRMRSDSEMSDVLTYVARNYRIDDSLRPAFEHAVDSMKSDYYRGSALSALRRSQTN